MSKGKSKHLASPGSTTLQTDKPKMLPIRKREGTSPVPGYDSEDDNDEIQRHVGKGSPVTNEDQAGEVDPVEDNSDNDNPAEEEQAGSESSEDAGIRQESEEDRAAAEKLESRMMDKRHYPKALLDITEADAKLETPIMLGSIPYVNHFTGGGSDPAPAGMGSLAKNLEARIVERARYMHTLALDNRAREATLNKDVTTFVGDREMLGTRETPEEYTGAHASKIGATTADIMSTVHVRSGLEAHQTPYIMDTPGGRTLRHQRGNLLGLDKPFEVILEFYDGIEDRRERLEAVHRHTEAWKNDAMLTRIVVEKLENTWSLQSRSFGLLDTIPKSIPQILTQFIEAGQYDERSLSILWKIVRFKLERRVKKDVAMAAAERKAAAEKKATAEKKLAKQRR